MDGAYKMCSRCIMDTTDPGIVFDDHDICNHCKRYFQLIDENVIRGEAGKLRLENLVAQISREGKGKKYDCIIGVSGGVDSTYVAYVTKQLGLRPLAVHFDNGWDSELAVKNIENVLKKLDIDLSTYVVNWEEFRDFQLSFLRASAFRDAELPTDHAYMACLYQAAAANKVKYILIGINIITEGILPGSWSYTARDWKYIKYIHDRFGKIQKHDYPHYSLFQLFNYIFLKRIKYVRILDYVDYDRNRAMEILKEKLGWQYYGGKHYESIYTRFFQGYLLPTKLNIDKRRAHLSTLVCSGNMPRTDALKAIALPAYPNEAMLKEDTDYVLKKLQLSDEEFATIMSRPDKTHADYRSDARLFEMAGKFGKLFRKFGVS